MIDAATRLFQRRGVQGSGMQDIVITAGAPRGSIYHHFPGGKDELVIAAITQTAEGVSRAIRQIGQDAASPAEAIMRVGGLFRAGPEALDWIMGCPVAATAIEGDHQNPPVREAVERAFRDWADAMAEALEACGMSTAQAKPLGLTLLASIEGALLVSRGLRSADAYDATIQALISLVELHPGIAGGVSRGSA